MLFRLLSLAAMVTVPAMSFQMPTATRTALATSTSLKNAVREEYLNDEECMFMEADRARECVTTEECSLEELATLEDALRQQRAQNEVYGLCSEEDMDLEWLEKAIIGRLEDAGVKRNF